MNKTLVLLALLLLYSCSTREVLNNEIENIVVETAAPAQSVSLSIVDCHEIERYVEKKCLTPESLIRLETLKEDDNHFVVKYYLHKEVE